MNASILKIVTQIHVVCGILSLLFGLIAMATKKGNKLHKLAGNVFYWAMFYIFLSTIYFIFYDPNSLKYQFFLGIGIVSFYPNWSGRRALAFKKGYNPQWFDTVAAFLVGLSGLAMLVYGAILTMNPTKANDGVNILFFIFGAVSIFNFYGDFTLLYGFRQAEKMHWFFGHGAKMIAAYSAAITAFCVNIVPRYLPKDTPGFIQIMVWVVPGSMIGLIGNSILKSYRVKFRKS